MILKKEWVLDDEADVNDKNWEGNTPLHVMMTKIDLKQEDFNKKMVKLLVDNGAKVGLKNDKNETPLEIYRKAVGEDEYIIKLLTPKTPLERGGGKKKSKKSRRKLKKKKRKTKRKKKRKTKKTKFFIKNLC